LNAQATFKIGVDQFYNIFTAGAKIMGEEDAWAFGYGIGTHIVSNDQFKTQFELISYHVNEGERWTNTYNGLQQARILFTKKFGDHFGVFAGPTINLMVTNNYKDNGEKFYSNFAPYYFYSHTRKNTTLKGWVGLTAGIHIN
jgi:hypothetical protein